MNQPTDFVTLVSNDGYEFKILRLAACIAGTIKKALDPMSGFRENTQNRVDLPTINGVVLEKVCEYLYYNQKHAASKDVSDMDIPPELCLELLIAADYLDDMISAISPILGSMPGQTATDTARASTSTTLNKKEDYVTSTPS
ncbi:POZ domain-containing protein [Ophiobolus disseminans]|uniref:Elongin-C n=1 Tax=Ophiobolus disseminans TaxID=1469910 RepID=A0A6A7AHJ0_9PLEO|nr:POZ domain-containing protein [Ophiobolus disseminans]